MTIGQWIRKRRLALGWSQQMLAVKLGITRSAIALWETGRAKPHTLRMSALGKLLGVYGK